jgi:hypothetical protein
METEKPQTLMNLAFVNQEGTEVSFMHAFADIEGMRLHWQGADEQAQQAYEYVEPIGFEICGSAGEQIRGDASRSSRWRCDAHPVARVRCRVPSAGVRLIYGERCSRSSSIRDTLIWT